MEMVAMSEAGSWSDYLGRPDAAEVATGEAIASSAPNPSETAATEETGSWSDWIVGGVGEVAAGVTTSSAEPSIPPEAARQSA